ncbi:MAG: DUF6584 family protein [Planctomycetota bacterium]
MPDAPQNSGKSSGKQGRWAIVGAVIGVAVVVMLVMFWTRADPAASFRRGLNALERRDVAGMHRELQVLRQYPRYEPQMQLLRGAVFLEGQNPQAALQEFDRCSIHPATRVVALSLAGEAFCRLDRQQEAIGVLQHAIGFDAKYVPAHRWLAIAYYDSGMHSEAISELRNVAELAPTDYRPHRLLGSIHKADARYAEAVQDYRASLRLAPRQPSRPAVLLELSQSLAKLGRYAEALTFLNQAPNSADIWACRAGCEYNLGHKSAARQAAAKAIELNPNHLEGLVRLGMLEIEAGRLVPAEQHLERAVKTHPQDGTARSQLAAVYQSQGKPKEAQEQLDLIETNQKLRERFSSLHEQAKKRPQDASLRFELGETARELQLYQLARMWYQATLALNPRHIKAQQALTTLPVSRKSTNVAAQLSQP